MKYEDTPESIAAQEYVDEVAASVKMETIEPVQKITMYGGEYLPWYKRIFPWRWRRKLGHNWLTLSEILAEQIREEIDKEIIEKIKDSL